ncbi:MAG: hypothetical protein RR256_08010, partial [Bacteroidales bacterium]
MEVEKIKKEIGICIAKSIPFSEKEICAKLLGFIDLTTLEGSDTKKRVVDLCTKAKLYKTAAVCVYPYYAHEVSSQLQGTGIKTACVAGGFPASQIPLSVKLIEVEETLKNGAD